MSATLNLTPAEIARIISACNAAAPHRVPILRAVCHGVIGLSEVSRDAAFPRGDLDAATGPIIAIISDDDYRSTGPSGFVAARRFAYWARAAIVHAAGGEPQQYEKAVDAALLCRRLLLVETDSAHAIEWCDFLGSGRRIPVYAILPRGGAHPVRAEMIQ